MTEEQIRQGFREYFIKHRNQKESYPMCLLCCSLPAKGTACFDDAEKLFSDAFEYLKERVCPMTNAEARKAKASITWSIFNLTGGYRDVSTLEKCVDEALRIVNISIKIINGVK